MLTGQEICADTVFLMSMTHIVIGAALGFIIAQGVLQGVRRFGGWLQRDEVQQRIRRLSPARSADFVGGLIRHAGLIGASAALVTLGVWTVRDHLAAKSAHSAAMASAFDTATPVPVSDPHGSADEAAGLAGAPADDSTTAAAVDKPDPYADPDFQVQRRPHRAKSPLSLKETLVQRSEAKARAELLAETKQHLRRSQYDCEAADRASRYVKGGLDVWGFTSWQVKYFPVAGYKGATLPQCKDIKNVVDPSWLDDLHSTVAQQEAAPAKPAGP